MSIGLVRDGVPVLGVVHAPVAPDDRGDLIAWADGLQLTRNDRVVVRPALAEVLHPYDIVLVSQDADQNPEANAGCVTPARFRSVPSIAYRLALLAVGEGEAAVSLNGPVAWDFAGGHALIRAVGGDLVDRSGQPISYGAAGNAGSERVFGASLAVARELSGRKWNSVFAKAVLDPLSGRFAFGPPSGERVRHPGLLSRAQGCLLGQVAGDALGGQVEFASPPRFARGTRTD